jgi:hypothetical protein
MRILRRNGGPNQRLARMAIILSLSVLWVAGAYFGALYLIAH